MTVFVTGLRRDDTRKKNHERACREEVAHGRIVRSVGAPERGVRASEVQEGILHAHSACERLYFNSALSLPCPPLTAGGD